VDITTTAIGGHQPLPAMPMTPVRSCVSWERAHASTPVLSTGGVRPDAIGGRRRDTSFVPSSGTPLQSRPV